MTFLFLALLLYFVPAGVAMLRKHKNSGAILVLNIFLGWTLIGWVCALVWACTAQETSPSTSSNRGCLYAAIALGVGFAIVTILVAIGHHSDTSYRGRDATPTPYRGSASDAEIRKQNDLVLGSIPTATPSASGFSSPTPTPHKKRHQPQ